MSGYIRPVGNGRRISSWYAHTRRTTPSTEPGTDYYCPIGTPVVAPAAGIVGMIGDSINPATGRYVFLKFDTGLSGRGLHLSRRTVDAGDRVKQGQIIGYSGASGYGKEDWSSDPSTGGAHIHWTFWPTHTMRFGYDANGKPYTLDPEVIFGGAAAGGEEDMPLTDEDIRRIWAYPVQRTAGPVSIAQEVADAKTHILDVKTIVSGIRADWQQGVAGVQNAGRLYVLLGKAAADEATVAEVDVDALAASIVAKLPASTAGATAAEVSAIISAELATLTLRAAPAS